MRAYCSFNSEILEGAIYDIQDTTFSFVKRNCSWKCEMQEVAKLIRWIEKSLGIAKRAVPPINYHTPPIKVKGYQKVITITEGENHICLNEELMIKFLEELKSVYDVYG